MDPQVPFANLTDHNRANENPNPGVDVMVSDGVAGGPAAEPRKT
jgi:hypothetical protein